MSANSTTFTYTLDSVSAAPTMALATDSGSSTTDKITNVGTVNVSGLEAGGTWQYSTNAGSTWNTGSGSSFTLGGDGAYSIIVRQTDVAGNNSANSAAFTYTLDTTVATPTLALATDSGSSTTDKITKVGTVNVTGLEAGGTWQYSTNGGSTWTAGTGTSFTLTGDGAKSVIVRQTDKAGNVSASSVPLDYTLDTTAPALTSITSNGTNLTTSGTLTIKFNGQVTGFAATDVTLGSPSAGTVTRGTLTDAGFSGGVHTFTLTFTKSVANSTFTATVANNSYTDIAGNNGTGLSVTSLKPAGASGSAINLALDTIADDGLSFVTVTTLNLPAGWHIDGGRQLADGSWRFTADELKSATVTGPLAWSGAYVLDMVAVATYADGTTATTAIANNIEAYAPGNPIFAWSGDDNLTGSAAADTFVFADPIRSDVIYEFDTDADKVDLIGFRGFQTFADVKAHLVDDADGNAVLTLADGKTIRFDGISAAELGAEHFVFNEQVTVRNTGLIEIGDAAVLPLSGVIENSGTIELESTAQGALLQVIQHGIVLQGGGRVVLSDHGTNLIAGAIEGVTFVNVDNTISGAGHLGGGQLEIVNGGTIVADGTNALVIDTDAHAFVNDGTAKATGTGGLVIADDIENNGLVWANGSSVTIAGSATGAGTYLLDGHSVIDFGARAAGRIVMTDDASATIHVTEAGFDGTISGFDADDRVMIDWLNGSAQASVQAVWSGASTLLHLSDGVHATTLRLDGLYDVGSFQLTVGEGQQALLTYTGADAAARTPELTLGL